MIDIETLMVCLRGSESIWLLERSLSTYLSN